MRAMKLKAKRPPEKWSQPETIPPALEATVLTPDVEAFYARFAEHIREVTQAVRFCEFGAVAELQSLRVVACAAPKARRRGPTCKTWLPPIYESWRPGHRVMAQNFEPFTCPHCAWTPRLQCVVLSVVGSADTAAKRTQEAMS